MLISKINFVNIVYMKWLINFDGIIIAIASAI